MTTGLSMDGSMNQINHKIREKENKRAEDHRRSILYLIAQHLKEHGLSDSYHTLFSEAQLLPDIQIADNIDLETILMEYESYYHMKFSKYPVICKTVKSNIPSANPGPSKKINKTSNKSNKSDESKEKVTKHPDMDPKDDINFGPTVSALFPSADVNENNNLTKDLPNNRPTKSKILKCIEKLYPADSELRKIAEDISAEIVWNDLNVGWDDVIGLEKCKRAIKEAIVYPIKYPIFFSDKFPPWKGILLYGPPGTGKTMLAKAAATECKCTFINVTASLLVSKWRGDSEKYIRVLFDLAYSQSPTIIFIDEIDWISTGKTGESLSEPAKRFRAELLTRLDGLLSPEGSNVTLLAATNAPWNIDAALRRRLEKQIYVTLPNQNSRTRLFNLYVSKDIMNDRATYLLNRTREYSAAEIKLICKEAWIKQSAPTWGRLEKNEINVTSLNFEIHDFQCLDDAIIGFKTTEKNISDYTNWNDT